MSDAMTEKPWDLVGHHVARRVNILQSQALDRNAASRSTALRQLAELRRAKADDPGDPRVWALTFDALPAELAGHDYEPSSAERAVHAALVLFALHAQSAARPRHVPGRRLGHAIGELAGENRDDGPTVERFHAFATATTWKQRLHHLRGLVALLRTNGIPLDYGSLAADLYRLQQPGGIDKVRLRWGRDFHFFKTPTTEEN